MSSLARPSLWRRFRCMLGAHDGTVRNGWFRCSWCSFAERINS